MTKGKTYSAADIERYHKGGMTATEMHELEKASLDDPFLADALEGYVFTPTPSADVSVLQSRLTERVKKPERRGAILMQSTWLRVAAVMLLVAGAGWLAFRTTSNPEQNAVATKSPVQDKQPAPLQTDSIAPETYAAKEVAQEPVNDNVSAPQSAPRTSNRANTLTKPRAPGVATSDRTDEVFVNKDVALSREVRQASPVSEASRAGDAEKKMAANTTDTLRNINVVMQPAATHFDETVTIGYGNKRKGPIRQQRVIQPITDTLGPIGGWPEYDDYVGNNITLAREDRRRSQSGEVQLQFDVNAEGEPVNIQVIKSLCSQCDKEAVRLLQNGPKWNANTKGGKIGIRF